MKRLSERNAIIKIIKKLTPHWVRSPQTTAAQIRSAEEKLNLSFPEDYKSFLAWSNGGEGHVGKYYISLWPAEELSKLNEDYQIPQYLGHVLGIGTDGGGICFVLDYRHNKSNPTVAQVPLGDLDQKSLRELGKNFKMWFGTMLADKMMP